ncbi:MAG: alginate export family protein [Methylococcaceae bacterium]|nr:alginate export family protein [Methylococcaceae bacterium]
MYLSLKSLPIVKLNSGLNFVYFGVAMIAFPAQAVDKVNYTKPPFAVFSSQMNDGLRGGGKYQKPVWNLHDFLKLPNWLTLNVEQRTRYETMDGCFRGGCKGGDQQIPLQTDVFLEARWKGFRLGGEFLDSREFGADEGSGINTNAVDDADFIQGYLAYGDQNINYSGIGGEAIVGRQTLNFGSRRLIARNVFRNTINSFTGARIHLTDYNSWQLNVFTAMPVLRLPTDESQLLDNRQQWDEEDQNTWFSGAFFELFDIAWNINGELYLYHLDEQDSANNATRNRRYFTPGFRFYRKASPAEFDFQTETIGQFGTVRGSTKESDGKNLDHAAWMQHVDLGYTFDIPWTPRLALEWDYASGDKNPDDNHDQRFDTLYGARRFDFGPTGIYGAFARSNINTPGYRITANPRSDLQLGVSHRAFWLASDTDSWTTTGTTALRDKAGKTSNYIGQQLELTARYDFNSSLNFETGWTHLFKGDFAKDAPNAPTGKDIDYFYVQSLLRF